MGVKIRYIIILGVLIFIVGWLSNSVYSTVPRGTTTEESPSKYVSYLKSLFLPIAPEIASPSDLIKESQIHVYNDRIQLDIPKAEWASFTDTNSMDPVIDAGSNAIELPVNDLSAVDVGDIISYNSETSGGRVIHRIIEKGEDEEGPYLILKGDNNNRQDPEKVRLSNRPRVVVAIIY